MGKYMVVEGVTFKKTDFKRVERVVGTGRAYVFVSGMKQTILIKEPNEMKLIVKVKTLTYIAEEK